MAKRVVCQHDNEHERTAQAAKTSLALCDAETAANIFHMLSDTGRLKIVLALMQGEMCVYHLMEVCGGSQSGISHQLRVLRDGKIVRARREGKTVEYSLADEHIRSIVELCLIHTSCEQEV